MSAMLWRRGDLNRLACGCWVRAHNQAHEVAHERVAALDALLAVARAADAFAADQGAALAEALAALDTAYPDWTAW